MKDKTANNFKNKYRLKYSLLAIFLSMFIPTAVSAEEINANANLTQSSGKQIEEIHTRITDYYLSDLDNANPSSGGVSLSGAIPTAKLYFSVAKDEIIKRADLNLVFTPSPALLPIKSQINVYLNGTLQQVIPIEESYLGRKNTELLELNPLLLKDYNELMFEFIGHYAEYCENIINSTIWLNVAPNSMLTLYRQKLRIQNDLSFFPLPFIHTSSKDPSTVNIVFKETDDNIITAASIFASYGGKQAGWRGINFPVFFDSLPADGHAVVFITNDNRPEFLKDYPKVTKPQIEITDISHSANANKLLIISAPTSEGLITVAKAIAVGDLLFNGPKSEIIEMKEVKKRKAYDAPSWINIEKKTKFSSLMEYDEQLSSQGYLPRPINLGLKLPPDLYYSEGSRINLNLKYNYTKPSSLGLSQMQFLLNNHIVRSYPLNPEEESNTVLENIPLFSDFDTLFNASQLDPMLLRINNLLTFDFQYDIVMSAKMGECNTQTLLNNHVSIDPRSTVDFTGLFHFTKMPNLSLFWQAGYPFSIYADLQDTVAIVGNPNSNTELTTLFNTLARIAGQINYPATNITVYSNINKDYKSKIENKDLLIIGEIPEFLKNNNLKVVMNSTEQSVKASFNSDNPRLFTDEQRQDLALVRQKASEGLSAIVSFRSPLNDEKTIVALVGDSDEGLAGLSNKVKLNSGLNDVYGSVTIIRENDKQSLDVGETYYVGRLPWYQRLWYYLLESPIIMICICLLCAGVFCVLVYRLLSRINKLRLLKQDKTDNKA